MDIADLKEILRILEEQDITEFELEQDGVKLRVCRVSTVAPTRPLLSDPAEAPAMPTTVAPAAAQASGGPVAEPAPVTEGTIIKSPIVGTFYRSPDPNSQPFVAVGDRVKVGQVLCIIEAMKLMNEIEAEIAGEVLKIHVENGQAVQYGDPLFTVRPA